MLQVSGYLSRRFTLDCGKIDSPDDLRRPGNVTETLKLSFRQRSYICFYLHIGNSERPGRWLISAAVGQSSSVTGRLRKAEEISGYKLDRGSARIHILLYIPASLEERGRC